MSDSSAFANKLEEQASGKGDLSYSGWASKTATAVPPPEAKKLTEEEAQSMQKTASGSGSLWNSGGTFEEKDVSKWAQEEVKRHLLEVVLESADGITELSISEVTKVDGDANIWVVRGTKRVGFDFNVTCKWSAKVKNGSDDPTVVTGKLTIPNMAVDELDELDICDVKIDGKEDADNKAARTSAAGAAKKVLPQIEAAVRKFHAVLQEK